MKKVERIIKPCATCGTTVARTPGTDFERVFCSRKCFGQWASKRMTLMNEFTNDKKMTAERKAKLREQRLDKGKNLTYQKTYGRHTHRVVAEQKIGRKLLPGEVVHHIDNNKRNNHPDNLMVFPSQREHMLWHKENDPRYGKA